MKKAFTLVEMLIVVVILAILMTIVFRLTKLGDSEDARTTTIVRMQRIENCLSGYYAAFGSYPPVKVHGWRDIYHTVDANGDQTDSNASGTMNQSEDGSSLVWAQVEAACRTQPFGCEYPPNKYDKWDEDGNQTSTEEDCIRAWSTALANRVGNSGDYPLYGKGKWQYADLSWNSVRGPEITEGGFTKYWENSNWTAIKLFKFGVMSYLLPRYLFMLGGDSRLYSGSSACAQWLANNDEPSDPFDGETSTWDDIIEYAQLDQNPRSINKRDLARVANVPTQAVCARWIPNLEKICSAVKHKTFFGTRITQDGVGLSLSAGVNDDGEVLPPSNPMTHYPPGNSGSPYRNASVTVLDGYGCEFYYYSLAPYQSYTLWSSGKNGKTFPPWMAIDKSDLNDTDKKTAADWKHDDIMQMSH